MKLVSIVCADQNHLHKCLEFDEKYFKQYIIEVDGNYCRDTWFKYLEKDISRTRVMIFNGAIIGYYRYSIMSDSHGEYAYLRVITVDDKFQKQGYGTILYDHFEKYVQDHLKVKRIKLSCPNYLDANVWYPKIGYNKTENGELAQSYEKKLC